MTDGNEINRNSWGSFVGWHGTALVLWALGIGIVGTGCWAILITMGVYVALWKVALGVACCDLVVRFADSFARPS
jgi:hypothetical protein